MNDCIVGMHAKCILEILGDYLNSMNFRKNSDNSGGKNLSHLLNLCPRIVICVSRLQVNSKHTATEVTDGISLCSFRDS